MKKIATLMSIGFLILLSTISLTVFSSCGKKKTKTEEDKYEMTAEDIEISNNFTMTKTSVDGISGYTVFRLKNTEMTEIVIPEAYMGKPILAISDHAFFWNKAITEVTISSSIKTIKEKAFERCENITVLIFTESSNLEYIGKDGFSGLAITELTIPSSVKKIDESAFTCCSRLSSLTFEENSKLEKIEKDAFFGNHLIQSLVIPSSVIEIGPGAFGINDEFTSHLSTVTFQTGTKLSAIKYDAFKNAAISSITIPKNVTTIGIAAFYRCASLISVNFESGSKLETIGDMAFSYCTLLTEFTVPASVQEIGEQTFASCSNLAIIFEAGSQLVFVGENAFSTMTYSNMSFIIHGNIANIQKICNFVVSVISLSGRNQVWIKVGSTLIEEVRTLNTNLSWGFNPTRIISF